MRIKRLDDNIMNIKNKDQELLTDEEKTKLKEDTLQKEFTEIVTRMHDGTSTKED